MAKSNNAGSRKTKHNTKSNTKSNIRKKSNHTVKDYSLRAEIAVWIIVLLGILLTISNLGWGGLVGDFVSGILFGLMGSYAFLFPFVLFFCICYGIANEGNLQSILHICAIVLLSVCISLFCALLVYDQAMADPAKAYEMCSKYKNGGGIIGAALAHVLVPNFGKFGAYAIDAVFIIIALVIITGRSFLHPIRRSSKTVARKLYEGTDQMISNMKAQRQEWMLEAEEEEEEEELPQRRIHRGVNLVPSLIPEEGEITAPDGSRVSLETYPSEPAEGSEEKAVRKRSSGKTAKRNRSQDKMPLPDVPTSMKELIPQPGFEGNTEITDYPAPEEIYAAFEEPVPETAMVEDDYASFHGEGKEALPETAKPEEAAGRGKRKPRMSEEEKQKGLDEMTHQVELQETSEETKPAYVFPTTDLLSKPKNNGSVNAAAELRATASKLEQTLHNFGVDARVTDYSRGPAVTRFEITPAVGVKVSKIVSLTDDIKLNLAAADIRIEAPIPGKAAVGIEVPNQSSSMVYFREMLESPEFISAPSKLSFAVGKDIGGKTIVANIAKMPHLLIAGATGSGKSVCINTIIMSILFKADPDEVKLIMVDPKVVELSVYNGIPHLLIPVVTDPKKATNALNWAVVEMTDRYNKFAEAHVRDISGYNAKIDTIEVPEGQERPKKLPQIVVIVDELADLMMVASKEVEEYICRLAQLARAAGIHLIIATQRPSVNVITGLIKANMPSRIAFAVTSGIDSRTILDMNGAEKLLGKGDMLFDPQGAPKPMRVQGAFVDDTEVQEVVNFIKDHNAAAGSSHEMEAKIAAAAPAGGVSAAGGEADSGRDEYFADAGKIITDKEKASIGMLQRFLKIGFNRAARIMDQLEEAGVVGPDEGTKPRQVLMSSEQFENYLEENG